PGSARRSTVSNGGKYIAFGAWEELQIHRTADGKLLHKIPGAISSAFAPGGQFLAVGSTKDVNIYELGKIDDAAQLQPIRTLGPFPWPVAAVVFGPDENKLFVLVSEQYSTDLSDPLGLFNPNSKGPFKNYKWHILAWDLLNRQ